MYKRAVFTFVVFIAFNSILYSQKKLSPQEQIRNIDALQDDTAALEALKLLRQNSALDIKTKLTVSQRLVALANGLQKYALATEVANEGITLAAKNKLDSLEAVFIKYIGITNYLMDRRRAAVPYFEKAQEIAFKHGFWELEASCYNNMGGALTDVQEYVRAEPYLLKSIEIMKAHERGDAATTLRTYRVLARMYGESGHPEKAEPIYLTLIEKSKANKDTALLCDNLLYYSEILQRRGEINKALAMTEQVVAYRRKQKSLHDLHSALNMHSQNLLLAGRTKEAYALMEEVTYLMRKIFAKDLEKEISEVEVKYKTAQIKREKEMEALEAKKQKQVYLFCFAGILLVVGFGLYAWNQKKAARQKALHLAELAEAEKTRFRDVMETEEKERARIAQELHDGLGQLLSTARLHVAGLEDSVSTEDKPGVERSLKIIDDACVEVRSISHNMMPNALIRLGLIPAITEVVNNVNAARGIKIDFTNNIDTSLGRSLDITIYRVVQEILNNMIRHAKASHISMSIERNKDNLEIRMEDNGIGFDTDSLKESKGMGWKNIFSRVSMLDGNIKLESEPEKGTVVHINLKLKNG